ncbi:uncharacterized protein ACLA_052710 [Aspergillus clavatus NRRL 1]|uniref:WAP domain-containing protein n=1 Tax=Aspergillus clavatus (strain ATCC 1007 / CBS 513.65 / DSM 816 / NCTC 3887 / NRRL 1 / QM 1276 / 107) TaxID=344612 RepID=A1CIU3_ASPCL|nr:uncharacterized protein ACLA_052710 [Aspergillus clavatus NRRL 1]EAW10798.1 hypothetical protein ACLA_052710 [Aspergillus clavatus NRRL 1]
MHFSLLATLGLLVAVTAKPPIKAEPRGCSAPDLCNGEPCPASKTCATFTKYSPTTATITTCIPTPTCLGVYQGCSSGGQVGNCCSGYCAATKCRSTSPKWPNCAEDFQLCDSDTDCCYSTNKCIEGICLRPT